MPRTTRTQRRSGKPFRPEYARSLGIDEMPRGGFGGGSGGADQLQPWQRPARREWRTYFVCGQIKPRLCDIVTARRA